MFIETGKTVYNLMDGGKMEKKGQIFRICGNPNSIYNHKISGFSTYCGTYFYYYSFYIYNIQKK
jgi:hypothetical protein